MSDDQTTLSILLPEARVAIFSDDETTQAAAQALQSDWRFARVDIEIHNGDIQSAASTYEDAASPTLLIVQTQTIEDGLTLDLEQLANSCDEGTSAIVIGPVNDVDLYRELVDMGVSDYLVRPVQQSVFGNVIAKALIDKLGVSDSKLTAIMGAKGGCGASAIAQAIAWGNADLLGKKTILMDIAGGWSSLNVGMGFEPTASLTEAADIAEKGDEDGLDRLIVRASEHLSVLATGNDGMLERAVYASQLEVLINALLVKYPHVVVDLSHCAPELARVVLARAHQIMLVSTPTLPALRLARSVLQEIKTLHGGDNQNIELIINMNGQSKAHDVAQKDIEVAMEMRVAAMIPYADDAFMKSESEGRKLSDIAQGAEIFKQYLRPLIAKGKTFDDEEEKGSFIDQVKGFLKRKK